MFYFDSYVYVYVPADPKVHLTIGQNKASSCSSSSHTTTTTVPPKQQHRRRRRSSRQKQKPNAVPSSSASATAAAEPTRMIKCICDTPNEGFGAMVQCDDCHRWLHLECLKMTDEFAHQENFACPQCFVSNDNALDRRGRVSSSITWRYAARRESERMAAAMDMEMTSDEEEEGHQDQKSMRCCDNDNDDDNDTDVGTHSEASTPEYYVQSQEGGGASRMDYFAPHASDVFLCESSYVFVLLKMLLHFHSTYSHLCVTGSMAPPPSPRLPSLQTLCLRLYAHKTYSNSPLIPAPSGNPFFDDSLHAYIALAQKKLFIVHISFLSLLPPSLPPLPKKSRTIVLFPPILLPSL